MERSSLNFPCYCIVYVPILRHFERVVPRWWHRVLKIFEVRSPGALLVAVCVCLPSTFSRRQCVRCVCVWRLYLLSKTSYQHPADFRFIFDRNPAYYSVYMVCGPHSSLIYVVRRSFALCSYGAHLYGAITFNRDGFYYSCMYFDFLWWWWSAQAKWRANIFIETVASR